MTLDEYLAEMKTPQPLPNDDPNDEDVHEEDLYQTSQRVKESLSKKIITYEIRESDEDDYDESN